MEQSPETIWHECLGIIRDNIKRQSFKTWFEPLKAVGLEDDDDQRKLTVQLPSRFYYEWLEEHYFGLLRKTVTKVLGPKGRLYYDIVIEKDDAKRGREGASMRLPARRPSNQPPDRSKPAAAEAPRPSAPSVKEPSAAKGPPAEDAPPEPAASEQQAAEQRTSEENAAGSPPPDQKTPDQSQQTRGQDRAGASFRQTASSKGASSKDTASEDTQRSGRPRPSGGRRAAGHRRSPQRERAAAQDGRRRAPTAEKDTATQEAPSKSPASSPETDGADGEDLPISNPFAIPGIQKAEVDSQLNGSYTFERFIEGDCNRLARSASWAIAQEPGATSFNPFLIYGGVGLGKTHLIQAIGNYAKANRKIDTALYVSSERFTTEFVQSIQHNRISQFSMFYRQIDLLIVDDVQFFGGKEKTQEEFFHIFNALHQSGKQIVLSSDRAPRDIPGIEERLLSRFQWGLSADVQPPELETRIAILQRKAEDDGIELPQEIIEFMAHNIKSNIRELEGALIRLLAHATLHKRELDLQLAKEVLRDLVKDVQINLTIEEIQRIVCEYMKVDEDLVRARTRKREVVRARQIAMFFCKDLTQHSLKTIGLHFGGRDHSTVIHANKTVEDYIETDPQFRGTVEEIRRTIDLRSR